MRHARAIGRRDACGQTGEKVVPPTELRNRLGFLMMPYSPGVPRYPTSAASSLSRPPTQVPRGSPSSRAHSVPCFGLYAPSGAYVTLGARTGGDKWVTRVLAFVLGNDSSWGFGGVRML